MSDIITSLRIDSDIWYKAKEKSLKLRTSLKKFLEIAILNEIDRIDNKNKLKKLS